MLSKLHNTFSGEKIGKKIFRQNPHDPEDHKLDMAKEAVPMIALENEAGFLVVISDEPGHCENYTTQFINTEEHCFKISSGDSGKCPGYQGKAFSPFYHEITENKKHVFRLVAFQSNAKELIQLRKDAGSANNAPMPSLATSTPSATVGFNGKASPPVASQPEL